MPKKVEATNWVISDRQRIILFAIEAEERRLFQPSFNANVLWVLQWLTLDEQKPFLSENRVWYIVPYESEASHE